MSELARATVNVLVEDLDSRIESSFTLQVWLQPRTYFPLAILDSSTGAWQTYWEYLGAYVTPNEPSLMRFLREASAYHPQSMFVGYQGSHTGQIDAVATSQVKALYDALQKAGFAYVNSILGTGGSEGVTGQRIRLPSESVKDLVGNDIDATVLFASLLESISLSPAICIVPGHAFLAWETWKDNEQWRHLETTMISTATFEEAMQMGARIAASYEDVKQFTRLPLRDLRAKGIFPME